MFIRKALIEDIDIINNLYIQAKTYFKNNNIDQWQLGYPNKDSLKQDILEQHSYVLIDDNQIIGTMFYHIMDDPTYRVIDGEWLTHNEYAVIHRIVVDSHYKGKGLAKYMLEYVQTQLKDTMIKSIRIDTHKDNISMQSFLKKNGFVPCGIITVEDGTPRIAFEKIL